MDLRHDGPEYRSGDLSPDRRLAARSAPQGVPRRARAKPRPGSVELARAWCVRHQICASEPRAGSGLMLAATALALLAATAAHPDYRSRLPEDEVIYFVLPDRFENGDPSNDRGGLSGDRLA